MLRGENRIEQNRMELIASNLPTVPGIPNDELRKKVSIEGVLGVVGGIPSPTDEAGEFNNSMFNVKTSFFLERVVEFGEEAL